MTFAQKLNQMRRQNGLSQEQLAEQLAVSRQAISRWENGEVLPDAPNLLALGKLFGVSIDYLLNEELTSDADLPAVQDTKTTLNAQHDLKIVQIICFGVMGVAFLWEIAGELLFHSDLLMLIMISVQVAAAVAFKVFSNRAEVPDPFRRRCQYSFLRQTVVLVMWLPSIVVCRLAWNFYWRPHSSILEEGSGFILYLAVCAVTFWFTKEKKQ